jgi:hypothetical protein
VGEEAQDRTIYPTMPSTCRICQISVVPIGTIANASSVLGSVGTNTSRTVEINAALVPSSWYLRDFSIPLRRRSGNLGKQSYRAPLRLIYRPSCNKAAAEQLIVDSLSQLLPSSRHISGMSVGIILSSVTWSCGRAIV